MFYSNNPVEICSIIFKEKKKTDHSELFLDKW